MILAVARTGWMNLRRDRAALILSFVVPIVFFSIFAGVFGAQRRSTGKVRVAVADEDHTKNSRALIAALKAEGGLKVVEDDGEKGSTRFDAKSAEEYVRAGEIAVAVVIPKGFGATTIQFGGETSSRPTIHVLADSSDPIAPQIVSGLVQKTVMTGLPDMMIGGGIDAVDKWSGGLTPQQRATLDSNRAALGKRLAAQGTAASTSPVDIATRDVVGGTKKNPIIAFYAAGIGVMFLLFTVTNAGGALLEEQESGTLDRILSTRLTFTQLLLGKLLYLWTVGVVQLTVMFLWGALLFKLELGSHLPGFIVMTAVSSFACAAFGLFIASLTKTRAQLGAISTLVVLTVSALGGSMFPRFLMPESWQKAGLVLFNAWALEGYTRVFWREEPLSALVVPVLVLLGNGILFFAIARRLSRRMEVT